jgi:hypothetical protein
MKDENTEIQRYKLAVEQVRYEAYLAWQNFSTYLIVHAILMAFLLRYSFDYESLRSNISVLIASLVGLLLCVPWRTTSLRNSAYHSFRMAQARELEPEGWNYICGRGQEFALGSSVKADGDDHRIPWLGRVLRRPTAAKSIVYCQLSS